MAPLLLGEGSSASLTEGEEEEEAPKAAFPHRVSLPCCCSCGAVRCQRGLGFVLCLVLGVGKVGMVRDPSQSGVRGSRRAAQGFGFLFLELELFQGQVTAPSRDKVNPQGIP